MNIRIMINAQKSAAFQQSLSQKFRICESIPKKELRSSTPFQSTIIQIEESIKQHEWDNIENRASKQCAISCAICFGFFHQEWNQVILCCQHVFHESCCESFERYCGERSSFCPICRKSPYVRKRTNIGFLSRKRNAATMIQSCIRGYLHRKIARSCWNIYYQSTANSNNAVRKTKFYHKELTNISNRVLRQVDLNHNKMESLIESVEQSLKISKTLDDMLKSFECTKKQGPTIPWELVINKALERDKTDSDCAICMCSMIQTNIVVLSCTHAFHERCFSSLESYCSFHTNNNISRQCPVCRSSFEKMHHYVE